MGANRQIIFEQWHHEVNHERLKNDLQHFRVVEGMRKKSRENSITFQLESFPSKLWA